MFAVIKNSHQLSASIKLLPSFQPKIFTVYLLFLTLVCLGVFWFRLLPKLQAPQSYQRDFAYFYLMARALKDGTPVYGSPSAFLGKSDRDLSRNIKHASPYPPAFAVLLGPLGFFSYRSAFLIWIGIETLCFLITSMLLLAHFKPPREQIKTFLVSAGFILWWPFFVDLYQGQMMMLALLLLTGSWLNLRNDRNISGGMLLGVLLSLKFYGWPILLFLLISKRYRATLYAVITFFLLTLISILWVGPDQSMYYVREVAPGINKIYQSSPLNFSAFAIGSSYFGLIGGVVIWAVCFCAAILMASKSRGFDYSFMIMLIVSAILTPVSWVHYFVTFLPAMCLLVNTVSSSKIILVGLSTFMAVADASYFVRFLPFVVVRPLPLLFALLLMCFLTQVLNNRLNVIVDLDSHERHS